MLQRMLEKCLASAYHTEDAWYKIFLSLIAIFIKVIVAFWNSEIKLKKKKKKTP